MFLFSVFEKNWDENVHLVLYFHAHDGMPLEFVVRSGGFQSVAWTFLCLI